MRTRSGKPPRMQRDVQASAASPRKLQVKQEALASWPGQVFGLVDTRRLRPHLLFVASQSKPDQCSSRRSFPHTAAGQRRNWPYQAAQASLLTLSFHRDARIKTTNEGKVRSCRDGRQAFLGASSNVRVESKAGVTSVSKLAQHSAGISPVNLNPLKISLDKLHASAG